MKRVLSLAVVLVALTTASAAVADDGAGPFGVTATAGAVAGSARVGVLVPAGRAHRPAGAHLCTASVVRAPYGNLLVTAAHCLDGRGALVFVPGYRDGRAPYGVWRVKRRFMPRGWVEGRREDSDVAFAVVAPRGGEGVEEAVGGYRFAAGTATGATAVTLTGYPDSRETPVSCTNKPTAHSPTQQRIACPGFAGGTSGSPWVNGDGQVVGVLGGHDDGGTTPDVSYSVVLRAEAERLYREAAGDP
ncbi:trypsin-like peptidase domain-containing protein [Streptomyces afghaniensis]|uniref:trypsin-like peptidase domain-containing protein n=1 Tax=Streptomyces afghaniensis TaxID=66865 RepID=UPI00277F6ACE|nr:trypsin-like peptidase domain-containing protein [Streptomyces afghaniensis]MDQ1018166.1 V8-like Glu-specific endopeptidase [Streptomyces afghaniensis]